MIHETAVVSEDAVVGEGVEIGPYAIVEEDVEIGAGSKIAAHAILRSGARIGASVTIESFAVIAGLPQDLSFDPSTKTYVRIGDRTTVREGSTINRATKEGEATREGEDCFLMAVTHLGHDCKIGNRVIIGNNSLLGGFVSVDDFAFLGGNSGIHQFCRIGKGVMFGGDSTATQDVPPFTMIAGRNELFGLNVVGLRRRGVSREGINPKIGDGVLISAGAKILGNIAVGEGAKIGAGSVVLRDVPPHTTVAGVPAKVVGKPDSDLPALNMNHEIPDYEW